MSTPLFKQFSGLRFKVLSALSAAFLVLFLGQFTAARIILLNGYAKLGKEKTRMSAEQVQNALSQELGQIDAITTDWAEWDDTYQFVEDGNKAYIASNLVNDTFKDLNLNVLLIANNSGQIVFGQAFDLQRQQRRDLPPELVGLLSQKKSPLLPHSLGEKRINGILLLSEEAILLSAHSILTSAEQGPVRGTLIMGRFLNEAEIKKLAATTKLLLGAYRYHDSQLPTDVSSILTRLSQKNPIAVQILDDSSIVGYVLLEDILGQPALILRTEMEQNIYAQGQAILSYYFSTTLAIAIMFYVLISILLEKLVLSRVIQLTQGVSTIGKTGNFSARVSLSGGDELSSLAKTINWTLERLKESQQAFQESQERYYLAVEGANDGIWDWNLLTDQIYFSPRWKAIFGYEDNEIDNNLDLWFERVDPQDIEPLKWGIELHLDGQTPHLQYEYQMQHKDGTYRWVLCRGLVVRDNNGKPYRMAGSLSDITDRKLAEGDLAQRTLELARSNAELEQFAYIASHDLQEPLRKIEAFGDRLKAKYGSQLNEQGRDYLERMQNSARRMRSLIEDLLAFSRVTTKAAPFVPVNLNEVMSEVISDLEVRIGQTQGQIEVGKLLTIYGDRRQIQQLFQNLLGNALKFHRQDEPPIVKIDGKLLTNEQYQISVTDNGIGFEEKYRDRIFQIFQRLHGRHEYEGTGVGLAICAKIVARHSGSIIAQSTPGQGTTFLITLPIISNQFSSVETLHCNVCTGV